MIYLSSALQVEILDEQPRTIHVKKIRVFSEKIQNMYRKIRVLHISIKKSEFFQKNVKSGQKSEFYQKNQSFVNCGHPVALRL